MWYNKCKEKSGKAAKSLHLEMNGMYKFDNGQISLEDFGQPVGMNLKNSNRWVKRAQTIPWIEIEKKYAKLFSNKKQSCSQIRKVMLRNLFASVSARELFRRSTATPTPKSRFRFRRIHIFSTSAATKPLTTASRRSIRP